MQKEKAPKEAGSQEEREATTIKLAASPGGHYLDANGSHPVPTPTRPIPAKLPENSRAAAAQRLSDIPEKSSSGYYHLAAHQPVNPPGWHLKRYIRRKNLRQSNERFNITERIGIKHALLPLATVLLTGLFIVASILFTYTAVSSATQKRYQQQVVTLRDIIPKDNLKMYDMHGTLLYQMTDQGLQTSEPLDKISLQLQHAEIAIEDQSFWNNPGYDITGIARAALDDLSSGHVVSGGSTITQQLIKNAIVGDQATMVRKLQEVVLAPAISRYYTKQQILEMYLNTTYYGEQSYGAEAAAFTYFGLRDKPNLPASAQLDVAQAATLAGIPSSPISRDPLLFPKASLVRTQQVLNQMYVQKYITHQQYLDAISEIQRPNFFHRSFVTGSLAPHFTNYALRELTQELHVKIDDLSRSGLIVSTTLDLQLNNKVLKDAQEHIAAMAKVHNMSNAAVVVIDPHNGDIRTLIGNISPNDPRYGQFDVASQGFRQPGSSFKPFIYVTAFEEGVSPGMPVLDEPLTVQMCCGLPSYTPHNYDMGYHGLITWRTALQNSFNIPGVKLLMQVGVDKALDTAERMGEGPYEGTPNYTMVLGSLSVHLLDETSAYGTFATGGVHYPAHAVDAITDVWGHVIFDYQPVGTRAISKQAAFIMTDVLSDNNARTFEFGKCSMLYLYSNTQTQCYAGNPGIVRQSAVKTGTSTNFNDNWTVGYTTDYVVGVWAGNNDNTPMVNVTGVDGAGPVWHDTMLMVEQGKPLREFTNPGGVIKKTVSYPGITSTDWYLK